VIPFVFQHQESVGVEQLPMLSSSQPELRKFLTVKEVGDYVLVVKYITPVEEKENAHIGVELTSPTWGKKGRVALHPCPYTTVCRQAVIDDQGRVAVFRFDNDQNTAILTVCKVTSVCSRVELFLMGFLVFEGRSEC